jgi:hypothetical protein
VNSLKFTILPVASLQCVVSGRNRMLCLDWPGNMSNAKLMLMSETIDGLRCFLSENELNLFSVSHFSG